MLVARHKSRVIKKSKTFRAGPSEIAQYGRQSLFSIKNDAKRKGEGDPKTRKRREDRKRRHLVQDLQKRILGVWSDPQLPLMFYK